MFKVKRSKKITHRHFNVDKYRRYKRWQKFWSLVFLVSILTVIYVSYVPTFSLFVIIAYIAMIGSFGASIASIKIVQELNKEKERLKTILQYADRPVNLLNLAPRIEYPYSVLKQIVDFLEKVGEIEI